MMYRVLAGLIAFALLGADVASAAPIADGSGVSDHASVAVRHWYDKFAPRQQATSETPDYPRLSDTVLVAVRHAGPRACEAGWKADRTDAHLCHHVPIHNSLVNSGGIYIAQLLFSAAANQITVVAFSLSTATPAATDTMTTFTTTTNSSQASCVANAGGVCFLNTAGLAPQAGLYSQTTACSGLNCGSTPEAIKISGTANFTGSTSTAVDQMALCTSSSSPFGTMVFEASLGGSPATVSASGDAIIWSWAITLV